MFIYKYMSTFMSTSEDEPPEEEDIDTTYDPHEHRRVPNPTSYAETMTHMLKGSLGAGLLAMPDAIQRLGLISGALALVGIGVFATFCIQLLILAQYQLCKRHRRGYMAYPKSMRLGLQDGPPCLRGSKNVFAKLVDILLVTWQIGICAIYFVFVGENVVQVANHYGYAMSVRLVICYTFPFLLVACLVKDLKKLTPFSTISNILTMLGLIIVFYYLTEEDLVVTDDMFALKSIGEIPVFVGITLFALEAVGVLLALEYSMEKPKEFTGVFGLFSLGMLIILTIYVSLGVFGYMKYGSEIKSAITLNLPSDQKRAQVSKLSFALALVLSFPLQNFVAYQIIWRKILKKYKPKRTFLIDYALRIWLVVLPFSMAVAAPKLGAFMGLMGALCLALVAIVFPAILDLSVYYRRYGFCAYKWFVDWFIIIFGTFAMGSGVYTSILEMYEGFEVEI